MGLAENVNNARNTAGLSRSELAKLIGISVNYIYQIEGGQKRPPIQVVANLADALNVKISFLLDDDPIIQQIRSELYQELNNLNENFDGNNFSPSSDN